MTRRLIRVEIEGKVDDIIELLKNEHNVDQCQITYIKENNYLLLDFFLTIKNICSENEIENYIKLIFPNNKFEIITFRKDY